MASEALLKELFEVAKASRQFAGMSDDSVWKACLAYKNRSDEDMLKAMETIQSKDQQHVEKAEERKERLREGKEKIAAMQEKEAADRAEDHQKADKVLEELFNS
jgi:hypothetical protein